MTRKEGEGYQILGLMNQRPIGVIVKVMDGRIQAFQAQYPMTTKIMIIRIMVIVIVLKSRGTNGTVENKYLDWGIVNGQIQEKWQV